jgi:hypothetical protein
LTKLIALKPNVIDCRKSMEVYDLRKIVILGFAIIHGEERTQEKFQGVSKLIYN